MVTPHIRKLTATESCDHLIAEILDNGAVIVEGFLSPELLARFNTEIEPHLAAQASERTFVNAAGAGFFGNKPRHLTALAARSDSFARDTLCHLPSIICRRWKWYSWGELRGHSAQSRSDHRSWPGRPCAAIAPGRRNLASDWS